MAVVLREVEHSDFDQIQRLFLEVYGKPATEGFKKAFFDHSPLLGFCLVDDSLQTPTIVGFFGCFTYNRNFGSSQIKIYNTHTWIIRSAYKKHSLKLVMPYLSVKDGVLNNFSANHTVALILEKLKFSKIKLKNYVVSSGFKISSVFFQNKIESVPLDSEIAKHHQLFGAVCLNLQLPNLKEPLELILKAVDKKPTWVKSLNRISKILVRKPLITKSYFLYKIHYTNQKEALMANLNLLSHYLFLKNRIGGLILPETLIGGLPDKMVAYAYHDDVFFKFNSFNLPQIDYLYSEVFYLNITDK